MTAVEQYDNRSVTFVEIACSYAIYLDEFFSGHACAFGSEIIILVRPLSGYFFATFISTPKIRASGSGL